MKIPNLWRKYTDSCDKSIDKPSFNFIALQGLVNLPIIISIPTIILFKYVYYFHYQQDNSSILEFIKYNAIEIIGYLFIFYAFSSFFLAISSFIYKVSKFIFKNNTILNKLKPFIYTLIPIILILMLIIDFFNKIGTIQIGEVLLLYILLSPCLLLFCSIIPFFVMLFKERKSEYRIKDKSVFENKVLRKFMYVSSLISYITYIGFFFAWICVIAGEFKLF